MNSIIDQFPYQIKRCLTRLNISSGYTLTFDGITERRNHRLNYLNGRTLVEVQRAHTATGDAALLRIIVHPEESPDPKETELYFLEGRIVAIRADNRNILPDLLQEFAHTQHPIDTITRLYSMAISQDLTSYIKLEQKSLHPIHS